MVEFLTVNMFAPADKDEYGKHVVASEQYQEKHKAYKTWFKRDRPARSTLLLCIHDNLLGEFEHCAIIKDI